MKPINTLTLNGITYEIADAAARGQYAPMAAAIAGLKGIRYSTNLYDKSLVIDRRILNSSSNTAVTFNADGILAGYVPVEEGKTYTITNGSAYGIGTVLGFFCASNDAYTAVCAGTRSGSAYYDWDNVTDKVRIDVFETQKATFTVLAGSGITHVTWHISPKAATSNTVGEHDGVGTYADTVQMNVGTDILPYEAYTKVEYWKYEDADTALQEQIQNLQSRFPAETDRVTVTKSGNQITLQTVKDGDAWKETVSLNGSKNNAFNLTYIYKNGEGYKPESDDICPVNIYGIYRGGNHGYNIAFSVTAPNHGKTAADIGSWWVDSNTSKQRSFLLIRVVDSNTLWMLGVKSSNGHSFGTDNPVSPLTHSSGATNTASFAFTSVTKRTQIFPGDNRLTVAAKADGRDLPNGETTCSVFSVSEEYSIIDTAKLYDYLVANPGKCTNETYFADAREPEMLVKNQYQYFPNGLWLIGTTAVALRSGITDFFYGLTQSNRIGAETLCLYVPYSIYDSLTPHPTEDVHLVSSTWRDENFPPYKFYQFDEKGEGFAVGYCIAHGQMQPEIRKAYVSDDAHGVYYSPASSKKMYPMAWRIPTANKGDKITGYAFRTPVKITDNICWYSYEIGNDTFVELEVFGEKDGTITLPETLNGKRIAVVKKTDNLNLLSDMVIGSKLAFFATGNASATLRLY